MADGIFYTKLILLLTTYMAIWYNNNRMDIWITYCRRKSKCGYCPELITAGNPMVVGKSWRRKKGTNSKWCFTNRWHPQCWLDQGLQSLEKHEYVPRPGRPTLHLDEETKTQRLKILRRYAVTKQRIRAETSKPEQSIDKIIHLGAILAKLKEEIEPYGGAPKSW